MIWNSSVELDDVRTLQLLIAIGNQRASDARRTNVYLQSNVRSERLAIDRAISFP